MTPTTTTEPTHNNRLPHFAGVCQCSACGEYFTSGARFDRHRVGKYRPMERRCLTPNEMATKGWTKNEGGYWTEKMPEKAISRRQAPQFPLNTPAMGAA